MSSLKDRIDSVTASIQTAKSNLRTALAGKEVTVPENPTFQEIKEGIDSIDVGGGGQIKFVNYDISKIASGGGTSEEAQSFNPSKNLNLLTQFNWAPSSQYAPYYVAQLEEDNWLVWVMKLSYDEMGGSNPWQEEVCSALNYKTTIENATLNSGNPHYYLLGTFYNYKPSTNTFTLLKDEIGIYNQFTKLDKIPSNVTAIYAERYSELQAIYHTHPFTWRIDDRTYFFCRLEEFQIGVFSVGGTIDNFAFQRNSSFNSSGTYRLPLTDDGIENQGFWFNLDYILYVNYNYSDGRNNYNLAKFNFSSRSCSFIGNNLPINEDYSNIGPGITLKENSTIGKFIYQSDYDYYNDNIGIFFCTFNSNTNTFTLGNKITGSYSYSGCLQFFDGTNKIYCISGINAVNSNQSLVGGTNGVIYNFDTMTTTAFISSTNFQGGYFYSVVQSGDEIFIFGNCNTSVGVPLFTRVVMGKDVFYTIPTVKDEQWQLNQPIYLGENLTQEQPANTLVPFNSASQFYIKSQNKVVTGFRQYQDKTYS